MKHINNDWDHLLKDEFNKEYWCTLDAFLTKEYKTQTIYPPKEDLFNALTYTPYRDVKVVILGQDPYHGPHQAHGLSFSVQEGIKIPPSLKNIYKELVQDMGCIMPMHGTLTKWAKQGVLLLNTSLSVREGTPNSHAKKGWATFSDKIITLINEKKEPVVFLLWGNNAKQKASFISNPAHLVLTSAHPSPLSAYHGFLGCAHFSQANAFLEAHHRGAIDWQI